MPLDASQHMTSVVTPVERPVAFNSPKLNLITDASLYAKSYQNISAMERFHVTSCCPPTWVLL